ncbi:hypothetical protein Tco_0239215 [Tanacetum coccineum]
MWSRYGLTEILQPPLEALTVKGISAIASRIGKPLIMDLRTASMCNQSVGRIGYARVLIEVLAKKGLPHKIDLVYKNAAKEIIGQKTVGSIFLNETLIYCQLCGI